MDRHFVRRKVSLAGEPAPRSTTMILTPGKLQSFGERVTVGTQDVSFWVVCTAREIGATVSRSPLLALAIAGSVGFVIGFVLRRLTSARGWRR